MKKIQNIPKILMIKKCQKITKLSKKKISKLSFPKFSKKYKIRVRKVLAICLKAQGHAPQVIN